MGAAGAWRQFQLSEVEYNEQLMSEGKVAVMDELDVTGDFEHTS